jgi:hypothetical protein
MRGKMEKFIFLKKNSFMKNWTDFLFSCQSNRSILFFNLKQFFYFHFKKKIEENEENVRGDLFNSFHICALERWE